MIGGGTASEAAAVQEQGSDQQQVWRMAMQACTEQQREEIKGKQNPNNSTTQAIIVIN